MSVTLIIRRKPTPRLPRGKKVYTLADIEPTLPKSQFERLVENPWRKKGLFQHEAD